MDFSSLEIVEKAFNELTTTELYDILTLRQAVFIVEQDCPYLDNDDKDQMSHHVYATIDNRIIAYARVVPPKISYENYSSIGRVVNDSSVRSKGVGKKIMEASIALCLKLYPTYPIKISAQVYILKFYNRLGFEEVGDEYLEDNIPHKAMILKHK